MNLTTTTKSNDFEYFKLYKTKNLQLEGIRYHTQRGHPHQRSKGSPLSVSEEEEKILAIKHTVKSADRIYRLYCLISRKGTRAVRHIFSENLASRKQLVLMRPG